MKTEVQTAALIADCIGHVDGACSCRRGQHGINSTVTCIHLRHWCVLLRSSQLSSNLTSVGHLLEGTVCKAARYGRACFNHSKTSRSLRSLKRTTGRTCG